MEWEDIVHKGSHSLGLLGVLIMDNEDTYFSSLWKLGPIDVEDSLFGKKVHQIDVHLYSACFISVQCFPGATRAKGASDSGGGKGNDSFYQYVWLELLT